MSDDYDQISRQERARRAVASMSARERLVLVANLLIDSLVELGDVPSVLRPSMKVTIDNLAGQAWHNPHEFTSAVLRQHGYRAEHRDQGGFWMFRAEKVDS